MSHLVQIQTQVRDPLAIRAACGRLGCAEPVFGVTPLFAGQQATGWAVNLRGWRYPVVCETTTGQLHYDNFSGYWGEQRELDRFLQAYAAEMATLEARKRGHTVTEQQLADGSIKLVIAVGGVA